jgi:cell wall assembly regulator SMI1
VEQKQTIQQGLQRISKWAELHYKGDAELIPGISKAEIERIIKNFPFKVPEEIIQFHATGYMSMFLSPYPNHFIPLDDITRGWFSCGHSENTYLNDDDDDEQAEWCEINIAYGSGKELYQARCYRHQTSFSPVWIRQVGGEPYLYASSLTNSILATAECYESGAYYPALIKDDREDFYVVEVDWEKAEPICKKYNPNQIDVWRDLHLEM